MWPPLYFCGHVTFLINSHVSLCPSLSLSLRQFLIVSFLGVVFQDNQVAGVCVAWLCCATIMAFFAFNKPYEIREGTRLHGGVLCIVYCVVYRVVNRNAVRCVGSGLCDE